MITRCHLRHFFAACASLFALLAWNTASAADAYPARPIRLLVPFAPGGGADTLARIITPRLSESMSQQWVVDNRGGAAGNIAAETVARAAPDGYTAFMGFSTVLTVNPTLYKLPFSVEKDLQPVTMLATAQYILVVHPGVPAHSLKDFVALAKQKPGALNYASAGVGSPLHLAAELFKKRAGINMVHLAYKGGGPAAAAVLSGEAQVIFGSVAASMPQVRAGKLRALATTGAKRSKVAPDLPTIAESGYPGFDVSSWYALLLPAKTPAAIVNRVHDEAVKALKHPEVLQAMSRQGLEAETGTPQELAARIGAETRQWAEVIREAGIKAE
ncbi:MAG TPA: tripartite tricarboxylate transporter substrate binding protein [Burkholderiales bacterium]|nr:tripartite tricarboxylate transporter substrate binding protein [Burkholderiales bacterium]